MKLGQTPTEFALEKRKNGKTKGSNQAVGRHFGFDSSAKVKGNPWGLSFRHYGDHPDWIVFLPFPSNRVYWDGKKNLVYLELKRRGNELHYYKTANGHEVDFACSRKEDHESDSGSP